MDILEVGSVGDDERLEFEGLLFVESEWGRVIAELIGLLQGPCEYVFSYKHVQIVEGIASENFKLNIIIREHLMKGFMKIETLEDSLSIEMVFGEGWHDLLNHVSLKHIVETLYVLSHVSCASYGVVSDLNPRKISSEI